MAVQNSEAAGGVGKSVESRKALSGDQARDSELQGPIRFRKRSVQQRSQHVQLHASILDLASWRS